LLEALIEIARGLASLWVFLFHLRPAGAHSAFWNFGGLGDLGVPAFFVISGFCIYASAASTIASGRGASDFLRRRLRRIFPPFWAAVALAVAVPYMQALLLAARRHQWQPPHPAWQAYGVTDWLLLLSLTRVFCAHGGNLDRAFVAVNAVYWSLAIEVQFYLVVAMALCWRRHFERILLAVTVAGSAALFVPTLYNTGIFLPYWPMFALGGALYVAMRRRAAEIPRTTSAPPVGECGASVPWRVSAWAWVWVAGCVAALAVICVGYARHAFGVPNLGYYTLFALGIAALLAAMAPAEALLQRRRASVPIRALLALGSASYSLYLVHAVFMHLPSQLTWMLAGRVMALGGAAWTVLVIAATVLFAYGFSVVCERPFASARRAARKLDRREDSGEAALSVAG
jgi:peptidoglycan/LPS O-acetylase OafA/YrhL